MRENRIIVQISTAGARLTDSKGRRAFLALPLGISAVLEFDLRGEPLPFDGTLKPFPAQEYGATEFYFAIDDNIGNSNSPDLLKTKGITLTTDSDRRNILRVEIPNTATPELSAALGDRDRAEFFAEIGGVNAEGKTVFAWQFKIDILNRVYNGGGEDNTGMDISFVTAAAGDILAGKTGTDTKGNPVYGTIETVSATLKDNVVTVPAGHIASAQKLTVAEITPTLSKNKVTVPKGYNPEEKTLTVAEASAPEISENVVTVNPGYVPEKQTFTVAEMAEPSVSANVVTIGKGYNKTSKTVTIPESGDLSVSGNVVTVPVGYIKTQRTATIPEASAPTTSGNVVTVNKGYHPAQKKITVGMAKSAATITPGTTDQIVAAGTYLSGDLTVKGDANHIAANIKKGVVLFGVLGTHEGSGDVMLEGNLLCLSHFETNVTNASFTDETGNCTLTVQRQGNVQLNEANAKFGQGRFFANYYNNNEAGILIDGLPELDAFTIEYWEKYYGSSTWGGIVLRDTVTGETLSASKTTTQIKNEYFHRAFVRKAGKTAVSEYINGVKVSESIFAGKLGNRIQWTMGGHDVTNSNKYGDELAIWDYARYTSDFTPPQFAYDVADYQTGRGGSGFYKCATVDTEAKTWTGYKAVQGDDGAYTFETTLTEGLTYTDTFPLPGSVYSADLSMEISKLNKLPIEEITGGDVVGSRYVFTEGQTLATGYFTYKKVNDGWSIMWPVLTHGSDRDYYHIIAVGLTERAVRMTANSYNHAPVTFTVDGDPRTWYYCRAQAVGANDGFTPVVFDGEPLDVGSDGSDYLAQAQELLKNYLAGTVIGEIAGWDESWAVISPNNLTSDTSSSEWELLSDSVFNNSYSKYKAFDGKPGGYLDGWLSDEKAGAHWLGVHHVGSPVCVTGYGFYPAWSDSNDAPKTWEFQGSNDGSEWVTLDSRTGVIVSKSSKEYRFILASPAEYKYFRLYVTENQGDKQYIAIGELMLYGYQE